MTDQSTSRADFVLSRLNQIDQDAINELHIIGGQAEMLRKAAVAAAELGMAHIRALEAELAEATDKVAALEAKLAGAEHQTLPPQPATPPVSPLPTTA